MSRGRDLNHSFNADFDDYESWIDDAVPGTLVRARHEICEGWSSLGIGLILATTQNGLCITVMWTRNNGLGHIQDFHVANLVIL